MAQNSPPAITEAESVIMEVLWRSSPLPIDEVQAALEGQPDWQPGTIKALLNRLLDKKAIRADKQGHHYLHSRLVTRDEWLHAASKGMLLFSGRLAPLAAHFSQQGKLTKRDIGELRRLLEELDDGE